MEHIIVGNWKMNLSRTEARFLFQEIKKELSHDVQGGIQNTVMIAPPSIYLSEFILELGDSNLGIAAQNVYSQDDGAYTGEISAAMLKSIGVHAVIIGHSERRQIFHESNVLIGEKVAAALRHSMDIILCIGETLHERESGELEKVLDVQLGEALNGITATNLRSITLAYEPVWAIGTGKTASSDQANEAHCLIRTLIQKLYGSEVSTQIRILYGGSVNEVNAPNLLNQEHIDGVLIGGASLKAAAFCSIMRM